MAAASDYALFGDDDALDTSSEEETADPLNTEPQSEGSKPVVPIKVPIIDGTGSIAGQGQVFKDVSYEGPTISGLGVPGSANWTAEQAFAQNLSASQRLQAERALEMAVKRRDAQRCAACLVQAETLGLDTSSSTAQLAYALADPEYLQMVREMQMTHELEEELKEFAELAMSGMLEVEEADGEEEEASDGEAEVLLASELEADGASSQPVPRAAPLATAQPFRNDEHQKQPPQPAPKPAPKPPAGTKKRAKRRKSPSLAEKLLLGANIGMPSSTEGESEDGEAEEEWNQNTGEEEQDPDVKLAGIWCYGNGVAEWLRVSRPERGLLLVDAQLSNGVVASGLLRREKAAVEAAMTTKDGKAVGSLRLRPQEDKSLAISLKEEGETSWQPEFTAERSTMWVCCPPERRPIGIRREPEFDAPRTGQVLKPGELFVTSAERPAGDVLWLQLRDGRGWVFDRQPGAATLCVRCGLPIVGFSVLDGFIPPGGEIHFEEGLTLEEAKLRCAALHDCKGFCYKGGPEPDKPVPVFFKNRWQLTGAGESSGWTSVRVEQGFTPVDLGEGEVKMTPAEEAEAQAWYDSISQGWLTRHRPEGANEGGINALEDILASMDRCDVAEDPDLAAVRANLEQTKDVGCTALSPVTSEETTLVPTGKLTSCLRPYSAKEGDNVTDPNAALEKVVGPRWVNSFRKHHPAARVSPGLALRALTAGPDDDAEEAEEVLPKTAPDPNREDAGGREMPWWEGVQVEVTEIASLEDRAAQAPGRKGRRANPNERSRMAMPKTRPLAASSSSRISGIPLSGAGSSSTELGSNLSGLFS